MLGRFLGHCGLHENLGSVWALLGGFVAWLVSLRVVAGLIGALRGRLRPAERPETRGGGPDGNAE
jgi:hypothetical protein